MFLNLTLHLIISNILLMVFNPVYAKTVDDIFETSKQNLKGHESLYNSGWSVITSSKEAIQTARQENMSAAQAMHLALSEVNRNKQNLSQRVSELKENTKKDAQEFNQAGGENTKKIFSMTENIWGEQWKFSKETYASAYSAVTLGYIEFGSRTKGDWDKLRQANHDFMKRTKSSFKDSEMKLLLGDLYEEANKKSDEVVWSKSLKRASDEFKKSYEESGEKGNSISGSFTMLWGHVKSLYYGLVEPSAVSITQGASAVGPYLIAGLIAAVKVIGDVVYTTGLNLYYSTKIGYHVFSPTVEGGFLGSLALASTATMPVVYAAGASLGVLNQVAVTTATPAVGTGQFILATTAEGAKYSAVMTYDFAKGAGEAFVHESHAAVVLGYNMLTQIPSQILLGIANGVVFVGYDGSRLMLATLQGEIDGVPVNQIPVGTVLDTKIMQGKGIKVEKLSDNPEIIHKVLDAAPKDLTKVKTP